MREKKYWGGAVKVCEAEGGKLAELTSEAEMQAAFNSLRMSDRKVVHIGGLQAAGGEEPAGGWYFLRSRLPVNMSLFYGSNPDNWRNGEHHLSAVRISGKVYYNDISNSHAFICECVRIA